jgi:hypothetical protein
MRCWKQDFDVGTGVKIELVQISTEENTELKTYLLKRKGRSVGRWKKNYERTKQKEHRR